MDDKALQVRELMALACRLAEVPLVVEVRVDGLGRLVIFTAQACFCFESRAQFFHWLEQCMGSEARR